MKNEVFKVVKFPGAPTQVASQNQNIVLTTLKLGQGSYGVVRLSFDKVQPSQLYAVKTIERSMFLKNPKLEEYIKNEIRLLVEIESPYVVGIRNATKTENSYHLAMELCNGGDLGEFVKARGGYLTETEAHLIMKQILKGFQAIKVKNIVHRDLKLANIIVHFKDLPAEVRFNTSFDLKKYTKEFNIEKDHERLEVKLADLGVSRKLYEDEVTMTSCGTPLMQSPELLFGRMYDHGADVWALGCIYYELVAGFSPFLAYTQFQLVQRVQSGIFRIPKTIKLSFLGAHFIEECLQYEMQNRISWQDLCAHKYILQEEVTSENETQHLTDEQLTMSWMPDSVVDHQKVLENPIKWMYDNKDKVHTLSTKDATKFEEIVGKRQKELDKFFKEQKDRDQLALDGLNNHWISNILETDVSLTIPTDVDTSESPSRIEETKTANVERVPAPLQDFMGLSDLSDERSADKDADFITRNFVNKGEIITEKSMQVTLGYF